MQILSIDIGGTFLKYACMTEDMAILTRGKIPTPQTGREALVEAIGQIYDTMPQVAGIAISMTGIIDSGNGLVVMGGPLAYNTGFSMGERLHRRCPVPIYMENDAKCAAMAEATVGALKDVRDGFVLLFGTMIGGGYIRDHRVYRGKHFSAGEVSYINTRPGEAPNDANVWGRRCGIPHLCAQFAAQKGLEPAQVDGVSFFAAAASGDRIALDCLDDYTAQIAAQIFNLQTVLDPERFAIGGGISAQPLFLEYIRRNLDQLYTACPYAIPRAQVVACQFRNDANLIGALQCYLTYVGKGETA